MTVRLAIVAATFNPEVTDAMVARAVARAKQLGVAVEVVRVPGTFEVPLALRRLLRRKDIDAGVAIGALIQGQTDHDDLLAHSVARALLDLQIRTGKPIGLGITGPGIPTRSRCGGSGTRRVPWMPRSRWSAPGVRGSAQANGEVYPGSYLVATFIRKSPNKPHNRAHRGSTRGTRSIMSDVAALESLLKEVKDLDGVNDAVLVSRSGMYTAGSVPEGVFQDTFVAMFAILLGAAETATSELKDRIDTVVLNLEQSRIVVVNDGPKAIFVLRTRKDVDIPSMKSSLERMSRRVEELL